MSGTSSPSYLSEHTSLFCAATTSYPLQPNDKSARLFGVTLSYFSFLLPPKLPTGVYSFLFDLTSPPRGQGGFSSAWKFLIRPNTLGKPNFCQRNLQPTVVACGPINFEASTSSEKKLNKKCPTALPASGG
jgi:hypothetical protein